MARVIQLPVVPVCRICGIRGCSVYPKVRERHAKEEREACRN